MSAAPRHPRDMGYAGLRMTADEFLALGETDARLELIDGVIAVSPSPSSLHQECLQEIYTQLHDFRRSTGAETRVFIDIDVCFNDQIVYRPDIAAYAPGRVTGRNVKLAVAPDLIVAVVSPGSKAIDFITKRDDYERFGVREYWAFDPADGRVRCWQREGAELVEGVVRGDHLPSSALTGFTLDIRPLRALAGL